MYLDQLPDLSRARLVRARSHGVAVRDGGRAVAVAFVADGTLVPADTLVRFDVTEGEDASRRLADALATTGARSLWFYGGDATSRRAATELDLQLRPVGMVLVHRMDASRSERVTFRPPSRRDRETLPELVQDHAPAFKAPQTEIAVIGADAVGMTLTEPLDPRWTELRAVVYAPHRGLGFGAALFAAAADRLEGMGRRVCAAIESVAGRERAALERAGFRIADYYFLATKR
jgi:GNAT superfamily N-acetyltransferase